MIKKPIVIVIILFGVSIFGSMWFIKTPTFVQFTKRLAFQYLPKGLRLEGDYTGLSFSFWPLSVSLDHPKIKIGEKNLLNLPAGSSIEVEKLRFSFSLFQILTGRMRVQELALESGKIYLVLNPLQDSKPGAKAKTIVPNKKDKEIHWDELLQIRVESVALIDVYLQTEFSGTSESANAYVNLLRLSQWTGRGGLGYFASIDLRKINGNVLKRWSLPDSIEQVSGEFYLNSLGGQLKHFVLKRTSNTDIVLSGEIAGNVLGNGKVNFDAGVKLRTDYFELLSLFPKVKELKSFGASSVSFDGNVNGELTNFWETSKIAGNLSVKKFAYKQLKIDDIGVQGSWSLAKDGGEVAIRNAIFTAREQSRQGGFQPGSGGRIEIGKFNWRLASSAPVTIPINLERAHIHWLGALALKDVYPLDLRVSGDFDVSFSPPINSKKNKRPWSLNIALKSVVEGFQLDNQRYGKSKPLTKIFSVPKIDLDGDVLVNSKGIFPSNLTLRLPHTKFDIDGKIDFKNGFDLEASGKADLADLGKVAENDIGGEGTLEVRVHGPSSRAIVDIDADLKNANYLRLFLGDFNGRITWDDDPQNLIFDHVVLKKGDSTCVGDGRIEVKDVGQINFNVKVEDGNIADLTSIFRNLTERLSWFPNKLKGQVSGDISIRGGLGLDKLEILSHLNGRSWDYSDERFRFVQLTGGYNKGRYFISDGKLTKRSGKIFGNISFDPKEGYDWNLKTYDLSAVDFDRIADLDIPVRGRLDIQSHGSGREGNIKSSTYMKITNFSVKGLPLEESQMTVATEKGKALVKANLLGQQGLFELNYDFNPTIESSFSGEFREFTFTPILLLLNPQLSQDRYLAGSVTGLVHLKFHTGQLEKATGSIELDQYHFAHESGDFKIAEPSTVKINQGSFKLKQIVLVGRSGAVTLDLENQAGKVRGQIGGDLDLSLLKFFSSEISDTAGTAALDLTIGGNPKEPTLAGKIAFKGNTLKISSVDSPFENINGELHFQQNKMTIRNLNSDLGGGRINAAGEMDLYWDKAPEIYIKSVLSGAKIKIFPFQYAKMRGVLSVNGKEPPYVVGGNIVVESALSREKVLNKKGGIVGSQVLQYSPPSTSGNKGFGQKFKLDLNVDSPGGVYFQSDLFKDVQAKAKLKLVNTLDAPRFLGRVDAIQGKFIFKDRVFTIQSGYLVFDSETMLNPRFDLNANTEIKGTKIQMYTSGRIDRMDKIKVEFTSNPTMQESEILSLLTVGFTSTEVKRFSANDISAVQQGEAASLVLNSLDFNREFEEKTGFLLQVDQSYNPQQGVSAFRTQSQADASAAPQITIRRRLTERLSLSAGSTVGLGTNRAYQFNFDYSVSRDLSLSGVFTNYGTYGTADAQGIYTNSVGLDLKFQRRFK